MDLRLLEKFFNKQCTPEEVAEVLRWFNDKDKKFHTLSAIEDEWQHFENADSPRQTKDKNARLENIHHHLLNREVPSQAASSRTVEVRKSVFKNIGFGFRVAAIVILAVLAAVSLQHTFPSDATVEQVAYITKSNPAGQKTTIFLEDGSKVTLNAASTLTYPEYFSGTERRLQLQGEAFFEVAEDTNRPFTVVAKGMATTALGTSFNIRAYEDENSISIALATGKVKVESSETTDHAEVYQLLPGELLTYDMALANYKKERFDLKAQLAWKDGIIYFHDASFEQVIDELSRWYGVSFGIENQPAGSWRYTGEFRKENLENVLLSISYAKKFDFKINDDTVKLVFH